MKRKSIASSTVKYLGVVFLTTIFVVILFFFVSPKVLAPVSENSEDFVDTNLNEPSDLGQNATAVPESAPLPKQKLLDVSFLVQAPDANWDALHEDACEEASLIMIKHFFDRSVLDYKIGEKEIQDLVSWEKNNGYGPSVTVDDLGKIAKKYYGLSDYRIEANPTTEMIETEIAGGHPVIIPAAGKILPNPNFRNGGPNYHMLVIKGYNQNNFVTNDPGTRKGEGFIYKKSDLLNAIRDWDASSILNGRRAYLVFD